MIDDTKEIKQFLDSLIVIGEKALEKNRDNKQLLKSLQAVMFYRVLVDFAENGVDYTKKFFDKKAREEEKKKFSKKETRYEYDEKELMK